MKAGFDARGVARSASAAFRTPADRSSGTGGCGSSRNGGFGSNQRHRRHSSRTRAARLARIPRSSRKSLCKIQEFCASRRHQQNQWLERSIIESRNENRLFGRDARKSLEKLAPARRPQRPSHSPNTRISGRLRAEQKSDANVGRVMDRLRADVRNDHEKSKCGSSISASGQWS